MVVEPTHLKNMLVKMGSSSPNFRGENKKCLKPPSRKAVNIQYISYILILWVYTSYVITHFNQPCHPPSTPCAFEATSEAGGGAGGAGTSSSSLKSWEFCTMSKRSTQWPPWLIIRQNGWEPNNCNIINIIWLVVSTFNPFEKYARQNGNQVGMKIKNIWNHHLVMLCASWRAPAKPPGKSSWEKENNLQTYLGWGYVRYVSSRRGNNTLLTDRKQKLPSKGSRRIPACPFFRGF